MVVVILIAGLFLAFANGANDNFKGVATLLGSRTTNYKTALIWASLTTFAGSMAAFFLAQKLMINFSGKGLVPDQIVQLSSFSISVACAAALTVFLATQFGFPISTTHAITGALVGAGTLASAGNINLGNLASTFFLPLLISPVIAIIGAYGLYPAFSHLRRKLGVSRESCICIGNEVIMKAPKNLAVGSAAAQIQVECCPQISVGTTVSCEERYLGHVWGLSAKSVIDAVHFLSAGLVGFARGLNDTPKIAAILLVGNFVDPLISIFAVAVIMGVGGFVSAKKIAETMSYQITELNDGQGLSANLVTSLVVIGASQLGVPVSTTHVSCGSLFGIGAVTKTAHWGSILKIVLAWLITLPVACVFGFLAFAVFRGAF
ncbi:MAG: phosphate permease [Bdellovibrionales bacterium RIFCSPHIGHO2_01_FULL_40_29]|nr:MAG: phosphate permease [Bdellovibrionales bacterium RIFCSPHIGHO2_01_FULL_40_29]OFZ33545.1 MAG: phosphate permease [Bdellovibrionales bacterium RIFCSPHIGHO2_02_FULL_40_15]